jgi:ABC-2 type transport system ATP-binding protein
MIAMMDTERVALVVDHVSHSYGERKALESVSFTVPQGAFTVLLGLNGAGKSTLFALITRLYGTRSGSISVFGHRLEREPGEALRRLGVVFQNRTLDLDLSVAQNLVYHAALHGISRREAMPRVDELLERFDLAERKKDKVRNLSGGQMRRVEIARSLLHRPRLLLLDEPTIGLDIKSRADLEKHVRRLVEEDRIGVLWATHLIDEVAPADACLILHMGKLLATGPVRDIVRQAGTEDIRSAFTKLTGQVRPIPATEAA